MTGERLLTAGEVAKYLGVTEITVTRWAKAGKLPGVKVGRSWRFTSEDVRKYTEQHRQAASYEKAK